MVFPDILHWDKWWEKLIQWTIIGIPISFFLYLSNSILLHRGDFEDKFGIGNLETSLTDIANQTSLGDVSLATDVVNTTFASFFASLLAPVLSLMVLAMGALISFKAVPEGAKGIMRFTTEKGVKRAWPQLGMVGATKAGLRAIRNLPETYREQRTMVGMTKTKAFMRTAATPFRAFWQKRQPPTPPATPTTTSTIPATQTAPAAPTTISHAEEIGLEGEAAAEEFFPPAPAIPTVSRKKRVAKWIGKWGVAVPAKIGYRSSMKILEAAENMAKERIEREMKIGKHKEGGEKTINCPYCLKKIPADSKFCPYCREQLE